MNKEELKLFKNLLSAAWCWMNVQEYNNMKKTKHFINTKAAQKYIDELEENKGDNTNEDDLLSEGITRFR